MTLKCGIIGLPNVGKSTLFNALTKSRHAEAKNYPFCTIEPNTGVVSVPDDRLEQLAKNANSQKIIPAFIEFIDIAGLVKGASKGEGLGNKFLSHIREVDAIIHVIRCFEDNEVIHVHGKLDPIEDAQIIETELIISDLESVEKRISTLQKRIKINQEAIFSQINLLQKCKEVLITGQPVRVLQGTVPNTELQNLQLITSKPSLYVCNVLEHEASTGNQYSKQVGEMARHQLHTKTSIIVSSKIEEEIAMLENHQEKKEFLESINLQESGLSKIIKAAYALLNLHSFFTVGPQESRAWTFHAGSLAPKAAGIIHNDFEKGFIKAEIINYNELLKIGTEAKAKLLGKIRCEGKDYLMQDGDVVYFRFNI
jgi:GTP-binding protein YchF